MGTRASIAFVDYDKTTDKYLLFVSDQFNGDMGPDMAMGEQLISYFRNIYFDKRNHKAKRFAMERIVKKLTDDFGYDREVSFRCIPLEKNDRGHVWIDLRTTYLDKEKKEIDYKNDVWSSWFDYSDYLYIVPICRASSLYTIDENEDGISEEHYLEKDCMDVYCFREYVGCISPDGKYTEKCLIESETEDEEDEKDILNEEPFGAAPPLSIVPPRKFVEIITQYKDGDRFCLVVRDSDNKHVLFKEMR